MLNNFFLYLKINGLNSKPTLKQRNGWILLESLAGATILSLAIVALLLTFILATKGTAASANRTKATYLAQQALDKLKAQDGGTTITMPAASTEGIYTITPSFQSLPSGVDTNNLSTYLRPCQVTVKWTESNGNENTVTMMEYCYAFPK